MNSMPKCNMHFWTVSVTFSLVGVISVDQKIWHLQTLAFSDSHLSNTPAFSSHSSQRGGCKNLHLKPSSCLPFQLQQNLNVYIWFAKLCVIPAYFFNFITYRLPCCPLCFSHRSLCQFPELVLFFGAFASFIFSA